MAKLEEIIKTEMSRSDSRTFSKIHLFKEGAFLRAYEQSAWLMSRHAAAELTPKRHKTKQTADGTFVFVGFPMTSLDKYRPEHSQDIPCDETHFILDLPADTFPEEVTKELYDADFERWKKEIALTDNKNSKTDKAQPDSQRDTDGHALVPLRLTDIMQEIMAYPLESKSPIETMVFVSELKRKLSAMI